MSHEMSRGGTCGRPDDHNGQHRSVAGITVNRESDRKYREANREKRREYGREYSRKYREENPEEVHESLRRWRLDNPERKREHHRNRRALKAGVPRDSTTREEVFALTDGWCIYDADGCEGRATDIEHIISIWNGGPDTWGNLVPACRHCNSSKHARDQLWIDERAPHSLNCTGI